jgi:hypothetical protein
MDDVEAVFRLIASLRRESPPTAAQCFSLLTPYPDQRIKQLQVSAAQETNIVLKPFEVLVFDVIPESH